MISRKFGRFLLPSLGIAMMVLAAFAVAPAAAQSGTATPQAGQTSQATTMPTVMPQATQAAPAGQATEAVPQTGQAQVQCFTYNDLVNQNLQPGSMYYMANSGDTLQGIADMFGITEQQLIQANNGLTTFGQATPATTPAAPAAGAFDLNGCVVSGANQPLDEGQVDGQSYTLAQGMLLQIPVSVSSLIPATGGQTQATPSAGQAQATETVPQTGQSQQGQQGSLSGMVTDTSNQGLVDFVTSNWNASVPAGQTLTCPDGVNYTTIANDTLGNVMDRCNIDVGPLAQNNAQPDYQGLQSFFSMNGNMMIGQSQAGQNNQQQAGQSQAVPQTGANFSLYPGELQQRIFMFGEQGNYVDGYYVAQNGDTLGALANRWGVSYQSVVNANPQIENPNLIFRGEAIHVPSGANESPEPNVTPNPTSTSSSSSGG